MHRRYATNNNELPEDGRVENVPISGRLFNNKRVDCMS
jgi:hypothetical protein